MASKKGLSSDEKRKRMLEFFFEKQDFFQLKDVEKVCSQEKGITIQTIKDILTSLVDDGLVESEKIGTSVYFWALPSRALQKRQDAIRKLENDLENELIDKLGEILRGRSSEKFHFGKISVFLIA
jgi:Fe2+ or Zn2+ uptake regulation protein